jgi:hypothetical protein
MAKITPYGGYSSGKVEGYGGNQSWVMVISPKGDTVLAE